MKKIKLVILAAVLLTAVLLLASCGAKNVMDLLDREYVPEDRYPAYNNTEVVSALTDMAVGSGAGDLKLFTKYNADSERTKYVVYDIANNKVVWQAEDEHSESTSTVKNTSYEVHFYTMMESSYFTVDKIVQTVTLENSAPVKTDTSTTVTVWAWNGSEYAAIVGVTDPRSEIVTEKDLLYFEGKVYRVDKQTKAMAYAFDYPMISAFPALDYSTENYYAAHTNGILVIYDKTLKQIATYEEPSYAEVETSVVIGDKVFLQYLVEEDIYGDDYDIFFESDEKVSVYTVLVDLEDGKPKKIDTNYFVTDVFVTSTSEDWEEAGFAARKQPIALIEVAKIEDKRVDTATTAVKWATLNEKGDIKILEVPTLLPITDIEIIGRDLWMVQTADERVYVINGEGETLAEIDENKIENGTMNYILVNGKIYDYAFNELYDYQAAKLEVVRTTPKAIMFENEDDELLVFANGQMTTLINKQAAEEGTRTYAYTHSSPYNGYFVIVDTTNASNTVYDIYNSEGKLIKSVSGVEYFSISAVATAENGAALIKITTRAKDATDLVATFYRFS